MSTFECLILNIAQYLLLVSFNKTRKVLFFKVFSFWPIKNIIRNEYSNFDVNYPIYCWWENSFVWFLPLQLSQSRKFSVKVLYLLLPPLFVKQAGSSWNFHWKMINSIATEPQDAIIMNTDYGRPERKKPLLHGRKFTLTPKFLGTAKAYFVFHFGPICQISLIYAFIGCP